MRTLAELVDEVYEADPRQRKPQSYIDIYEEIFAPLRHKPVRILEMGVRGGQSIHLWHRYFEQSLIVGVDFHDPPVGLPADRVHYLKGMQQDPETLDAAVKVANGFDLVIDDAAHVGRLAKVSFDHLFPSHLAMGGLYILEDIAAGIRFPAWSDHKPYQLEPDSGDQFPSYDHGMFGWTKKLIDNMATGGGIIASMQFHPGLAIVRKVGPRQRTAG